MKARREVMTDDPLLVQHVGMRQRNFRLIETNGITLRVVVEGDGPLLVLLHGFPQCWYLWRHQIDELVADGYQVAVPDQRGYGGSDKPAEIEAYDGKTLVADVVGIADALGHETFTLVTHDFGAVLGWDIAFLHPDRVSAVFALSVPPVRMQADVTLQDDVGDNFFYVVYFQQPGVAEAELDADLRKSLRMLHYAVSGDAPAGLYLQPKPASSRLLDGLIDPDPLPSWLSQQDLDAYCEAYADGFRGPINWYAAIAAASSRVLPSMPRSPSLATSWSAARTPHSSYWRPPSPASNGTSPTSEATACSTGPATGFRWNGPRKSTRRC
jgi:epoxide hydrolase A/B